MIVFLMVALVDINILAAYYYTGMGYEFLTSIILVISIGFSVDYSAHVAYAYSESNKQTRQERAKDAIVTIARPVTYDNIPVLFQNGATNRGLRCGLHPAPSGAACKTCLESRINKFREQPT